MTMIDHAPRDAARARQLRDLLHDCVASTAAEQAERLIEAIWLLPPASARRSFAAMVDCGAYESAAALMFAGGRPYLVSRGANGVCLASAMSATSEEEVTAEAASPALAMLAAHVAALLAQESEAPAPLWPRLWATVARLH